MRTLVLAPIAIWSLCGCRAQALRIDPAPLCAGAAADSTWHRVAVANGVSVMVPASVHPFRSDQDVTRSDERSVQEWGDRDLLLAVDIAWRGRDSSAYQTYQELLSKPDTSSASSDCSAPAPEGWIVRTRIWRQGGNRIVAIYAMPVGRREATLQCYIIARRERALRDAVAIAKSFRALGAISPLPSN